jgi:hypothetical protein
LSEPFKITELYAWIGADLITGEEGIPAVERGGVIWPMVGADAVRVESLRPDAAKIAAATGVTLRLVKFSTKTELEVINPPTSH